MPKSLIRKNQLHPDIADLVSQYGTGIFASNDQLVQSQLAFITITGNQTISGIKNFIFRPTVNGSGVLLSGDKTIVYTTGNQSIDGEKNFNNGIFIGGNAKFTSPADPGGDVYFRFDANYLGGSKGLSIHPGYQTIVFDNGGPTLQLDAQAMYLEYGGGILALNPYQSTISNNFSSYKLKSGVNGYIPIDYEVVYNTGNQTISGIKTFVVRPTVNGTGVLLSSDIPSLPTTIVYATGDQEVFGHKSFEKISNLQNAAFLVSGEGKHIEQYFNLNLNTSNSTYYSPKYRNSFVFLNILDTGVYSIYLPSVTGSYETDYIRYIVDQLPLNTGNFENLAGFSWEITGWPIHVDPYCPGCSGTEFPITGLNGINCEECFDNFLLLNSTGFVNNEFENNLSNSDIRIDFYTDRFINIITGLNTGYITTGTVLTGSGNYTSYEQSILIYSLYPNSKDNISYIFRDGYWYLENEKIALTPESIPSHTHSINDIIDFTMIPENTVYLTGDQTISGVKTFASRPTVNGTGVLLSGEVASLPTTIVYTTGDQTISGVKTFINTARIDSVDFTRNFVATGTPYNFSTVNTVINNDQYPTITHIYTGWDKAIINPSDDNRSIKLSSGSYINITVSGKNDPDVQVIWFAIKNTGDSNPINFDLLNGGVPTNYIRLGGFSVYNFSGFLPREYNRIIIGGLGGNPFPLITVSGNFGIHNEIKLETRNNHLFLGNSGILFQGEAYLSNNPSGFITNKDVVYTTGDQTISGTKTFATRPQVNGTGVLFSGEAYPSNNPNGFIAQDLGTNGQLLVSDNTYGDELGIITNNDEVLAVKMLDGSFEYGGGYPGSAPLSILNNIASFTSRPNVNGTGVLLSGEAANLPTTIVYTTGNQTISGVKTFASRPTVNGTGVLLSGEMVNNKFFNNPLYSYFGAFFTPPYGPMSIVGSNDGYSWDTLSTRAHPSPDELRDPSIIKIGDRWVVAYTEDAFEDWPITRPYNSGYFGILESKDLQSWDYRRVNIQNLLQSTGLNDVRKIWGPEWFREDNGDIYLIFNPIRSGWVNSPFGTNNGGGVPYIIKATDNNLTGWGNIQRLTGSTAFGYMSEVRTSAIDYSGWSDYNITKVSGTYYCTFVDGANNEQRLAYSTNLITGWAMLASGKTWYGTNFPYNNVPTDGTYKEGGCLRFYNGKWRFWTFDVLAANSGIYCEGTTPTAMSFVSLVKNNLRLDHGTVIESDNYVGFVNQYGNQSINGVKNFTSRPTINGTGVLLSGEAASLPTTIVYTTGDQTIAGIKTFSSVPVFNNGADLNNKTMVRAVPSVVSTATAPSLTDTDHNGRVIYMTNTTPVTITIPAGLSAGFNCAIIQGGGGSVTIANGAGVTLNSYLSSKVIAGIYATVSIVSVTQNNYIMYGNTL